MPKISVEVPKGKHCFDCFFLNGPDIFRVVYDGDERNWCRKFNVRIECDDKKCPSCLRAIEEHKQVRKPKETEVYLWRY